MEKDVIFPSELTQKDPRTLSILWNDSQQDELDVVLLRRFCPCAFCVDEWTRERTLKPESIPETVRPIKIVTVGRYALNIRFSDGHQTGIYTFQFLRELAKSARDKTAEQ